jgi:hypothetical protein
MRAFALLSEIAATVSAPDRAPLFYAVFRGLAIAGIMPRVLLAEGAKTWMAGTWASESDAVLRTAMPGHDPANTIYSVAAGGAI